MPQQGKTVRYKNQAQALSNMDETVDFMKAFEPRKFSEEIEKWINISAEKHRQNASGIKNTVKTAFKSSYYNWISDSKKISRENAIKLAFLLGLNTQEAELFLSRSCWLETFHFRNVRDVIYVFCLDNGKSYNDALTLIEKYPERNHEQGTRGLTNKIRADYYEMPVRNEDELNAFIITHQAEFGKQRYTAYAIFMEFYKHIESNENLTAAYYKNENDAPYLREEATCLDVCEVIATGFTNRRNTENPVLSLLLLNKDINKDISKIIKKEKPVDRRYLMLAWLNIKTDAWDEDDSKERHKIYENLVTELNGILESCGMPQLDPCHPLDWLIDNVLRLTYKEGAERMDAVERVIAFNEKLFAKE